MKNNEKLGKLQVLCSSAKHHLNCSTGHAQSELLNSAGLSWHTCSYSGVPALHFPNSCSHPGEISSSHASKLLKSPDADPWIQNSAQEDQLGSWLAQIQQSLTVTLPGASLNLSSTKARSCLLDMSGPQNSIVKPARYFNSFPSLAHLKLWCQTREETVTRKCLNYSVKFREVFVL